MTLRNLLHAAWVLALLGCRSTVSPSSSVLGGDSGASDGAESGRPDGSAGDRGSSGAVGEGEGGDGGAASESEGDGDVTIGPRYADSPDLELKDVPHGTVFKLTMSSTESKIFTGADVTLLPANRHAFTREIDVYIPKQYVDGTAAPILVAQDGYLDDLVRALDNLIAEKRAVRRLPTLVTIFVANGGGDAQGSERGLEYDTLSNRYARFIETEVLPAVLQNSAIHAAYPHLAFSADPDGRGAYGCSSGGAAAFTMGWFEEPWFHRIITYSGSFVDQQDDAAPEGQSYPEGAWEYPAHLIADTTKKPLRVFLEAGENDNGSSASEASHLNWLLANQRLAAALKAKGNHYRFVYAQGAGHCDTKARRQTLPDTLLWMWRGYPLE